MPRQKILDFDGDGRFDLLLRVNQGCIGYGCSADFLYLHQAADGTFVEPIENPFAGIAIWEAEKYVEEIDITDWNSDGLPDIVFMKKNRFAMDPDDINPEYIEHVVLRSVLPHSHFNPFKYIDLQGEELHLADVNSDGHADVVLADSNCNGLTGWGRGPAPCLSGSGLPLRLYQHVAGLNLKEVPGAFQNVTETELGPFRIAIIDWDQDGDHDLLVAAFDGRLHYHEMIGGSWQEESQPTVFANITFPVMSGEVRHESEYNATSGTWDEFEREIPRQRQVQPVPVDWDGDGDNDLVLAPEGWYWERLSDGTLLEYPLKQSPFRNASLQTLSSSGHSDAAWRFVDCDGDGDLDLVRKSTSYWDYWPIEACEHDGSSLICDSDFLCLGMNLSDFGTGSRVYSFDFADLDGDGQPELVSGQSDDRLMSVWSVGFCTPSDACLKKGICQPDSQACACIAGHELHDCSGCEPHFYSIPRAGLGQMPGFSA